MQKELYVILLQNEFIEKASTKEELEGTLELTPIPKMEVSMNQVMGLIEVEMMKFKVKINTRKVMTLIDCKVTHNFIFEELVEEL